MPVVIAVVVAFLAPFGLVPLRLHPFVAWLVSCLVVPAYVLYAEFVLPYAGGGASMWPIALVIGGIYSATAGGVGTLIAVFLFTPDGLPGLKGPRR
jgi:hypothetical protein